MSKCSSLVCIVVPSDLCLTSVDEQFNTCDITAVIGCKKGDGFCDLIRITHPTHRYGAQESRLHLLSLLSILERATEARCVGRTRTDGVDTDFAVFEVDRPRTRERPYRGLGCPVNTQSLVSFGPVDRSSENDRTTVLKERKCFLYREQKPFHIDI
jgi:hypothetical protein